VWTHAVAIGQQVYAGAILLCCETMKTEFPVETALDGIVVWLRPCGETVEAGDVVAILEVP
jgi:biotin carboxyl carrier protein